MAFLLFCALLAASGSICTSQTIDFSLPVTAAEYQGYLGGGFNANYFKRARGPLPDYNPQNIQILKDLGFRNLRIRCNASLYNYEFTSQPFRYQFLANLVKVVDDCIDNGIAPIVTFRDRDVENRANEQDLQNYLDWWRIVAEKLKDRNYLLSFNLFTELGPELCVQNNPGCPVRYCCSETLNQNTEKYNRWTSEVISIIRGTGGNNAQRILILASPKVSDVGLKSRLYKWPPQPRWFDLSYVDNTNMMMDWHRWASGPSADKQDRLWTGTGTNDQKQKVIDIIDVAKRFTARYGIPTYQGEWMPRDKWGQLNEMEVISFAKFFVESCEDAQIPWTLNSFDQYYDTRTSTRKTYIQKRFFIRGGTPVEVRPGYNMSLILDTIVDAM